MKIVVVEDDLLIRGGLRHFCHQPPKHEVVGEAGDGRTGLEMILRLKPDLVVLDLGLPVMDGFAVMDEVRAKSPATKLLIVSGCLNEHAVMRVDKAGLRGFVDKGSNSVQELQAALAALDEGGTWFSQRYRDLAMLVRRNTSAVGKILSDAEQDVLGLVGEGLNDAEIAWRMDIAPTTAQTHRSRILRKLKIRGTPKLVAFAIQHGFTQLPSRSPFPAPMAK